MPFDTVPELGFSKRHIVRPNLERVFADIDMHKGKLIDETAQRIFVGEVEVRS